MPKKFKVFLDTSAILAGLNSPAGAAGVVLSLCREEAILPIISPDIVVETDRNIGKKFPDLYHEWQSFLLIPPTITEPPTIEEIRVAFTILPTDDAPILASAMKAGPDFLLTWNTRHFLRTAVLEAVPFPIVVPGNFLKR